jgi:hypothetical protein
VTDLKIPFCRVLERRSKSTGATYRSGRLGDARLIAFRENGTPEDELFGAVAAWQIFITVGDQNFQEREERRQRPPLAAHVRRGAT